MNLSFAFVYIFKSGRFLLKLERLDDKLRGLLSELCSLDILADLLTGVSDRLGVPSLLSLD